MRWPGVGPSPSWAIASIYTWETKGIIPIISSKKFKVVYDCLAIYWVLMLDNCYWAAGGLTITFLANSFHIYLED